MWKDIEGAVNIGLTIIKAGEGNRTNKKVMQIDKNGNLISKYFSIANASQKTSIHAGDIGNCANGRIKSAGGYKWQFA
jgi:hypothetical protein